MRGGTHRSVLSPGQPDCLQPRPLLLLRSENRRDLKTVKNPEEYVFKLNCIYTTTLTAIVRALHECSEVSLRFYDHFNSREVKSHLKPELQM